MNPEKYPARNKKQITDKVKKYNHCFRLQKYSDFLFQKFFLTY